MAQSYPGIIEAKDIAEEGFIYGLPIVMNYAVMYEFAVDKNSGQFKAPFNQINNEHHVFTHKDTAVVTPNSDTPYSFVWLDLRAEPIVLSVPAVDKKRYYSVQLCDGNTYNYGYIGSRATGNEAGDYMVVGPDWKGETPAGHQEGVPVEDAVLARNLSDPAFQPGRHDNVKKVQAGYKVQPLSAFLNQPPRPPRRRSIFRRSTRNSSRLTSSNISTSRCSSPRRGRTRQIFARSLRASASDLARPSISRTYRSNTSSRSVSG